MSDNSGSAKRTASGSSKEAPPEKKFRSVPADDRSDPDLGDDDSDDDGRGYHMDLDPLPTIPGATHAQPGTSGHSDMARNLAQQEQISAPPPPHSQASFHSPGYPEPPFPQPMSVSDPDKDFDPKKTRTQHEISKFDHETLISYLEAVGMDPHALAALRNSERKLSGAGFLSSVPKMGRESLMSTFGFQSEYEVFSFTSAVNNALSLPKKISGRLH